MTYVDVEGRDIRQLLKLGRTSVGVTLPKEWAKKHGLGVGSRVSIAESDDRLILSIVGPIKPTPAGIFRPCPLCGVPIGVPPETIWSVYRKTFRQHGIRAHSDLTIKTLHETCDTFARACIVQGAENGH